MDRKQHLQLWLSGIFVAALIVADLIGGKFFRFADNVDLSVGMLAFPITFVLTDVCNEFFGAGATRRLTFLGLGAAMFSFAIIQIALALPISPESPLSQAQFGGVFGWSGRLYVASLTAYLVGQFVDIGVFTLFRRLTRHRLLWLRATGSTIVSQGFDTLVVNFVLLSGTKSTAFILGVAGHSYVTKILIAVGLTPIIYGVHAFILRVLHVGEPPESLV